MLNWTDNYLSFLNYTGYKNNKREQDYQQLMEHAYFVCVNLINDDIKLLFSKKELFSLFYIWLNENKIGYNWKFGLYIADFLLTNFPDLVDRRELIAGLIKHSVGNWLIKEFSECKYLLVVCRHYRPCNFLAERSGEESTCNKVSSISLSENFASEIFKINSDSQIVLQSGMQINNQSSDFIGLME